MNKSKDLPVYRLLVENLQKGFEALDAEFQTEIKSFIKSQQHENGAFTDRAAKPDLYYSLFGLWLSMATGHSELLTKLKQFIPTVDTEKTGPVEQMAHILIQTELEPGHNKRSVLSLFRMLNREGKNISLSYRFFLFALLVDAFGKNKAVYYFVGRIGLFFYRPKTDFPCSLLAAFTYARKMLGMRFDRSRDDLLEFAVKSGGFKAFNHTSNSDMLSTGVALFVLKETKADMRLLTPATLEFIQHNFYKGAFLSGDGDQTKDLEYTFYGLLALGSLVKD